MNGDKSELDLQEKINRTAEWLFNAYARDHDIEEVEPGVLTLHGQATLRTGAVIHINFWALRRE
jgi:hypothetical protein